MGMLSLAGRETHREEWVPHLKSRYMLSPCTYKLHSFSLDSMTSSKDLKGFPFSHISSHRIPRATQGIRLYLTGENLRFRS